MPVETGNYIGDLNSANPLGTDQKSTIDNHLRLIKSVLKICFGGFSGGVVISGADTGILNAPTLTPSPALPGYTTGMLAVLRPAFTNTSTVTLNISGLGVKAVKSIGGAALGAGDLVAGDAYLLWYDGTDFRIVTGPTKNYVDNLSFSSALPSMTGNAGKWITTVDGVSASWGDPGVNLALSGTPTAPTAAADTNTTQVATTAFVVEQGYAKLVSPTLTGTPTAPVPSVDSVTSQIINGAWYIGQIGTASPTMNGSAAAGTSKKWTPIDHVHPTDTSRAPLNSPAFTGDPTAPNVAADSSGTYIANCNFVLGQASDSAAQPIGTAASGSSTRFSRADHVHALTAASQAQMEAASNNTVSVTPNNMKWHPGVAKFWINCDNAGTILASHGVTSITDISAGRVQINFSSNFSSSDNMAITALAEDSTTGITRGLAINSKAFGAVQIFCVNATPANTDPVGYHVVGFGDL